MARGGGSVEAGGVYHIISRFTAKEWFIESAVERRLYLSLLGDALRSCDWTCFSYAVMSSHIHLGLVAGADSLAAWLRPMHTVFANWLNARRERIGAVFVKGPNVLTVGEYECARLINYIHFNPVRAGVVDHPGDSDWTSYRAYVGATQTPRWLTIERGLAMCQFASAREYVSWAVRDDTPRSQLIASGVLPRGARGRPATAPRMILKRRNPPEQEAGFFRSGGRI